MHHARKHQRNEHVQQRADDQGVNHGAGHIALRILAFLGGGGNGIEADEGEKHRRDAEQHAAHAVGRKRIPVVGIDEKRTRHNHHQNHNHLENHQSVARIARFLDANVHQCRNQGRDQKCRNVHQDFQAAEHRGGLESLALFQNFGCQPCHGIALGRPLVFQVRAVGGDVIGGEIFWKVDTEPRQHFGEITRPADGNHHIGNRVFKN